MHTFSCGARSLVVVMEKIWKYLSEHKQHLPEIERSTQMKFTIPFEKTTTQLSARFKTFALQYE